MWRAQRLSYPRILHFHLSYCSPSLHSDTQRLYSVLYHTHSTKVSHVFNQFLRPRISSVVLPFLLTLRATVSSRRPSSITVSVVVLSWLDISTTRASR